MLGDVEARAGRTAVDVEVLADGEGVAVFDFLRETRALFATSDDLDAGETLLKVLVASRVCTSLTLAPERRKQKGKTNGRRDDGS